MINSKVLAKLRAGEFVRATAVGRINDAWIADLVGRTGFDALWYDLEHQTGPDHAANGMSLACRATGMDLMVRVRKGEYGSPMRMLEAGANGLMVPHIRSADEARQWVEWCRFPPLGKRGFDGAGVDADYMLATPLDHMRQANEQVFLTFQIEDREALDGIDDIAGVPGYDILFVGPGDLSISLGVPFQMDHPAMQNAIETVARAASAHGKWWGIPAGSPAAAQRYLEQGARFLAYGSDHVVLVNGFQRLREDLSGLKLP
jgi:4-hydroxy-2-oxoheptanedioate aldolase